MDRFLDPKDSRFDFSPTSLVAGFVRNGQPLHASVDRGSHILPYPPRPDQPAFVEQFDIARRVDLAHEVKASGRQGQSFALKVWDQSAQFARQLWHGDPPSDLRRRFACQTRRPVMMMIPTREGRRFGMDMLQVPEGLARPERLTPEAVKGLDLMIAFGVVDRREDGFDATKQAQPHDPTDHQPMRMAATKRAFVVELMQVRQSEFSPDFQEMRTGGRTGFVGVLGQASGLREPIYGMEVLNLCAAVEMASDDIGRLHGIDSPNRQPRIISRFAGRAQGVGQPLVREDTLDRRFAWQWIDFQFAQLAPDRASPNQAWAGRLEPLSNLGDQLLQFRRPNRADGQRCTRVIGKIGMRIGSEYRPPFVEPSSRALQIRANIFSPLALETATNGLTTKFLFTRVHSGASSLRKKVT